MDECAASSVNASEDLGKRGSKGEASRDLV